MILELILFEITGIGGMLGYQSVSNVKAQCRGINAPKELPIIDAYLRHRVGRLSKQELYVSTKAVAAVQRLSKYRAFRYLLVYFWREVRVHQLEKGRNHLRSIGSARWYNGANRV
jgi:hypothetical protein